MREVQYFIKIKKNVFTVGKREVIVKEEKVAIYRDLEHAIRKLNEMTKDRDK